MTERLNNIVMLPISQLYHHPDNPRKNLGDVTELAESIKHSGVMQNLTVVRGHYTGIDEFIETAKREGVSKAAAKGMYQQMSPEDRFASDGYTVVIGNRRLEASKLAGLAELPCVVSDMDEKEQLATMLSENMQRADLTVAEQVAGIQLCLDFGMTDTEVMNRTGLSRSTYNNRKKLSGIDNEKLTRTMAVGLTLEDWLTYTDIPEGEEKDELDKELDDINPDNIYRLRSDIRIIHNEAHNNRFIREVIEPFFLDMSVSEENSWYLKYRAGWAQVASYKLQSNKNSERDFLVAMSGLPYGPEHEYAWCVDENEIFVYESTPDPEKVDPDEKAKEEAKERAKQAKRERAVEQNALMKRIRGTWLQWIHDNIETIEKASTEYFPSGDAAILRFMLDSPHYFKWDCRKGAYNDPLPKPADEDLIYLFSASLMWDIHKDNTYTLQTKFLPEIRIMAYHPRYFFVVMWILGETSQWMPYMKMEWDIGMQRFSRDADTVRRSNEFYNKLCSLGYVATDEEDLIIAGSHPLQRKPAAQTEKEKES